MSDGRIAGKIFRVMQCPFGGLIDHSFFNAAMMVAKRDFQMINMFAMALEPEMSRFDNSGVNRSNGYFVNVFAFDAVEVASAGQDGCVRVTQRFKPRMTFRFQPELFSDFPFE